MCLALALVGCQRENPAFNPDVGGDVGTEGDASTTQTSTTQTTTTMSTTGDGDGDPGDGDGDGDGEPDGGMESPVEDIPDEVCEVETHEGLWPRLGSPNQFLGQECPPSYIGNVRVHQSDGAYWLGGHCQFGCDGCDQFTLWQIGAEGLDEGLAGLFPPMSFDPNAPWVGCYHIVAETHIKQTNEACYYASLSVHVGENAEGPLLFNANRESSGLTDGAAVQYDDWKPPVADQMVPACLCDDLEIPCCSGSMVVAKHFILGEPVFPGGEPHQLMLNQSPFMFYGAQAQSGTTCGLDPETSWALWRSP